MKKLKSVKGWGVYCSKRLGWQVFSRKHKAVAHAEFLDNEYTYCCTHKVIPVLITPISKK